MSEMFHYLLEFTVRDYEVDMQGIVNNAVYQNYLEHTRHCFLKSIGVDFAEATAQGILLVVARAQLLYKSPLKSGDVFISALKVQEVSRAKVVFNQLIIKKPTHSVCLQATITASGTTPEGKVGIDPALRKLFCQLPEPAEYI